MYSGEMLRFAPELMKPWSETYTMLDLRSWYEEFSEIPQSMLMKPASKI
jgi:hypothetical protein